MMDKLKGKELLLEISSVLDMCNLPFFLIQGTALGAYRDSGFVPAEKDIDLGILQEDLTSYQAISVVSAIIKKRRDVEVFVQPLGYPHTIVVWGDNCKLDLVAFSKKDEKRFTPQPLRPWIKQHYCIVHDAVLLETYQRVEMFGWSWKVPSPIETYLELEYGPGWKVPKDDHVSRTRDYYFSWK